MSNYLNFYVSNFNLFNFFPLSSSSSSTFSFCFSPSSLFFFVLTVLYIPEDKKIKTEIHQKWSFFFFKLSSYVLFHPFAPPQKKGEGGGKSRREYLVYIYTFNTVLVPKKTFQGLFHSFKGNNLTGNWSNKTLSFIWEVELNYLRYFQKFYQINMCVREREFISGFR